MTVKKKPVIKEVKPAAEMLLVDRIEYLELQVSMLVRCVQQLSKELRKEKAE
jgi:hypothetical protein